MAGIQFLGTFPRQPGYGEQIGEAIRGGTSAFFAAQERQQELAMKKEELTLKKRGVDIEEQSLKSTVDRQLISGMMQAMSSALEVGDKETATRIAKGLQDQFGEKYGFNMSALLGQAAAGEGEFESFREKLHTAGTITNKGGAEKVARDLTYRLVKEGKSVREATDLTFGELGGEKISDARTKQGLYRKVFDYATLAGNDISQFRAAAEAGERIGPSIQSGFGKVGALGLLPIVEAAKRMQLGIPIQPGMEALSRVGDVLKGTGPFLRGASRGIERAKIKQE